MARTIFLFLICFTFYTYVICDCTLDLNRETTLLFVKKFGSQSITFRKNGGTITLKPEEHIHAYCSSNLKFNDNYNNNDKRLKSAEILCSENNRILYKSQDVDGTHYFETQYPYSDIYCSESLNTQLYESNLTLPNCEKFVSYAIGTNIYIDSVRKDLVTAGICYDLNTLTLKYATYIAHTHKIATVNEVSQMPQLSDSPMLQTVSLDQPLDDLQTFFKFMSEDTFSREFVRKQSNNELLIPNNFDYMSLIQDESMAMELQNFKYIFNTIWWRNLRLGNWRLFSDALEKRSKDVDYVVYVGSSGVLSIPSAGGCNKTETLSIQADGITVQAPEYIWAYLELLDKNATVEQEFVVIGHNSPFYDNTTATIFCKDICNQIDWLSVDLFARVRLMPTRGVVFCCHPEEVTRKFKDFPQNLNTVKTKNYFKMQEISATDTSTAPNSIDYYGQDIN